MSNSPVRPGSDEEWEALLRQLRQQPKAQPRPFFYARVHARLTAKLPPASSWLPTWVRRPAYVALLGALGLALSGDDVASRPLAFSLASPPRSYPANSACWRGAIPAGQF